jgi:hypothetical protein
MGNVSLHRAAELGRLQTRDPRGSGIASKFHCHKSIFCERGSPITEFVRKK